MAYHYEGSATTQTGKIIYERKKHLFKSVDLRRVVYKVPFPDVIFEEWAWLEALLKMLEEVQKVDNDAVQGSAANCASIVTTFMQSSPEFTEFSGGEMGGAGASRLFGLPFPVGEIPATID